MCSTPPSAPSAAASGAGNHETPEHALPDRGLADLGLTDQNHECACSTDQRTAVPELNTAGGLESDPVRAHYLVDGMTCSHCVSSVTAEVSAIVGVDSVSVDLNAGGRSRIMVVSAHPIGEEIVSRAVTEAGYTLISGH